MDGMEDTPREITRREVLRRGLLLGGGLIWVTPSVQVVNMSKAYAQVPSPGVDASSTRGPEVSSSTRGPEVAGKTVTSDVQAESLPFTGSNVLPLAGLAGGLLAAGGANLKAAKHLKRSKKSNETGPEPAEGL